MPRPIPNLDAFSDVYVDESSQTKHRYLALGGLIVPTPQVSLLTRDILAARLPDLPQGEMAWTKVSSGLS